MTDYNDLDQYNDDTVHDMWVDYDHYENAGTPAVFDDEDMDNYVDSLPDWD